jgi:hypothetical protein
LTTPEKKRKRDEAAKKAKQLKEQAPVINTVG